MKKGNYILNTLNGMAYGFFCSLVIGTILKQVGAFTNIEQLVYWGDVATYLMGATIGVGIAYVIEAKGMTLISAVIAGAIGAGTFTGSGLVVGDPVSAYIAVIIAVECTKFIQGKTPLDILLIPFTSIVLAGLVTVFLAPYLSQVVFWIGNLINEAVHMQPIVMSIVVAVLMGMILTGPISSAALGMMLNLSGLAAGAALAGCCAQMVGFAVMTIDDNSIGDVIAVGLGSSMLQFKNVIRKPIIWLPPIITTIIISPIATVILGIECNAVGSGMGTAGLVGILAAIEVMGQDYWIPIVLINIVAPAILTYVISKAFKKLNYIKKGDLKLTQL
jgi:PTS system IIC component